MAAATLRKNLQLAATLLVAAVVPASLVMKLRAKPSAEPVAYEAVAPKPIGGNPEARAFYGLRVERPVVSLGDCPSTGYESGEFFITNVSAQAISIQSMRPECGCTTVDFAGLRLGSGESVHVPFHVDVSHIGQGPFIRQIAVVLAGGPPVKSFALAVAGSVGASNFLLAIPGVADFGAIRSNQEASRRIHIRGPSRLVSLLPARFVIIGGGASTLTLAPPSAPGESDVWGAVDLVVRSESAPAVANTASEFRICSSSGRELCKIPIRCGVAPG